MVFIIQLVVFLPQPNDRPRYLQMYFYDIEHEIGYRFAESEDVRRDIVLRIQRILDQHIPFVHKFRQLAQIENLHQCKLIIKEQPPNQA